MPATRRNREQLHRQIWLHAYWRIVRGQRRFEDPRRTRAEKRRSLRHRHSRLQPAHHGQPPGGSGIEPPIAVRAMRPPRISAARCRTCRPTSNPKNSGGVTPITSNRSRRERNLPPDHRRIAAQFALPEPVADHRAGTQPAPAPVVRRREEPPHRGRHAQHSEEVSADPQSANIVPFSAGRDVERVACPCEDSRERLLPLANLLP